MGAALEVWEGVYPALALAVSLFLLACRWERTPWAGRWARSLLRRILHRETLDGLELWHLLAAAGALLVAVSVVNDLSGAYACQNTGVDDPLGILRSGQAFLQGQDPFYVSVCGVGDPIPYGLAGVLLDALGAPFGILGVLLVWDLVALVFLALVWEVAGEDRRYTTLLVLTSALYFPEVLGQIDGATNIIVPVTLLLSLLLLRSRKWWAAILGGFLSTARFPALFAVLGTTGRLGKDRVAVPALAVLSFAAGTAAAYALWGASFFDRVFLAEVTRASGSENLFGLLFANHWTPSGYALPVAQALLTLLVVEEVWRRRFSPLLGGSVVLVAIALLTNFLSFSILIWLLPLALVGPLAQRGLWAVSLVGTVNYDLAFNVLYKVDGILWPGEVLDVAMTAVLLALFLHLWREGLRGSTPQAGRAPPEAPAGSAA